MSLAFEKGEGAFSAGRFGQGDSVRGPVFRVSASGSVPQPGQQGVVPNGKPSSSGPSSRPFSRLEEASMSRWLLFLLMTVLNSPVLAQPANVVPLVARTPNSGFNRLTVSVTVCPPDGFSGRCATIDRIMVDTGSVGLRLQARALPPGFTLPPARDAEGKTVAQCLRFLNSAAWGGVHRADIRMGGMVAADIPIQVVGHDPPRPDTCDDGGTPTSNGTLGIGVRPTDCDGDCIQGRTPTYYACDAAGCTGMVGSVPPAVRVPNPVQRFPAHNNGLVLDLPTPSRRGVAAVQGTLTFGVNTAPDNQLGSSRILSIDGSGHFTTRFHGRDYPRSYIDSGTEYTLVPDISLSRCHPGGSAICEAPTRSMSATRIGTDGSALSTPFLVGRYPRGDENGVFAAAAWAAVPESSSFVWGAPFFLGRRVTLLFRDHIAPGVPRLVGPAYADEFSQLGR